MSHAQKGISLHGTDAGVQDRARGVSVFDSEDKARTNAHRFPHLGRFVAQLDIPEGVRIERTTRAEGHYTVWGAAGDMLSWVVRVTAVDLE